MALRKTNKQNSCVTMQLFCGGFLFDCLFVFVRAKHNWSGQATAKWLIRSKLLPTLMHQDNIHMGCSKGRHILPSDASPDNYVPIFHTILQCSQKNWIAFPIVSLCFDVLHAITITPKYCCSPHSPCSEIWIVTKINDDNYSLFAKDNF